MFQSERAVELRREGRGSKTATGELLFRPIARRFSEYPANQARVFVKPPPPEELGELICPTITEQTTPGLISSQETSFAQVDSFLKNTSAANYSQYLA